MKSFTAGPNENGVRLSRFVEGVTKDMPRSMMYKAFCNNYGGYVRAECSLLNR